MTDYNKKGYFTVDPEYRNSIPEATRGISWDDAFFQNDDDVVAVFDFDYDQMFSFQFVTTMISQAVQVGIFTGFSFLFLEDLPFYVVFVPLGLYALSGAPFLLAAQVRWRVYAQHCAVTRDGIRFVNDKQKSRWGLSMCDIGKQSKTVPFDKITDCDIHEPAGNTYCCVPNVLTKVIVDTASSGNAAGDGQGTRHELELSGLKAAHSLKKLVWAMKRAKEAGGVFSYNAPAAPSTTKTVVELSNLRRSDEKDALEELERGCNDVGNHEIPGLLKEIRNELRRNNDLLQEQQRERNTTHREIV